MSLTLDVLPIMKTFPPAFAPLAVVRLQALRYQVLQEGAEEDSSVQGLEVVVAGLMVIRWRRLLVWVKHDEINDEH